MQNYSRWFESAVENWQYLQVALLFIEVACGLHKLVIPAVAVSLAGGI